MPSNTIKHDDCNLGRDTQVSIKRASDIAYTRIGTIYSIGDVRMSRSPIDVTPYGADHKHYAMGICDSGTFDIEVGDSARHPELYELFLAHEKFDIRIEFPSNEYLQSAAYVSMCGKSTKIDDVIRTQITLLFTGTPQWGETVTITGKTTVQRGLAVRLTASCPVTWSLVTDTTDPTTTIDDGLLTFGLNEMSPSVTVKATSLTGEQRLFTVTAEHEEMRVIPERAVMARGESRTFGASQPVRGWIIESEHDKETTIEHDVLTISEHELARDLWIRCDSIYDKSAFALVRITDKQPVKSEE